MKWIFSPVVFCLSIILHFDAPPFLCHFWEDGFVDLCLAHDIEAVFVSGDTSQKDRDGRGLGMKSEVKCYLTTCEMGSVYPYTLLLAPWMKPSLWKVILEQWVRVSARSGPCASHRQSRAQSMAWLLLRKWRLLVRQYATGSCTTKNARCVFSGKCFNRQLWRALRQCCVDFIQPGRAKRHWYCLCQHWGNLIERKIIILTRALVKPVHFFFLFLKTVLLINPFLRKKM